MGPPDYRSYLQKNTKSTFYNSSMPVNCQPTLHSDILMRQTWCKLNCRHTRVFQVERNEPTGDEEPFDPSDGYESDTSMSTMPADMGSIDERAPSPTETVTMDEESESESLEEVKNQVIIKSPKKPPIPETIAINEIVVLDSADDDQTQTAGSPKPAHTNSGMVDIVDLDSDSSQFGKIIQH